MAEFRASIQEQREKAEIGEVVALNRELNGKRNGLERKLEGRERRKLRDCWGVRDSEGKGNLKEKKGVARSL